MPIDATMQPVSPAWLTDALRRTGVLAAGTVTGVEQRASAAFNSNLAHLVVTYSADAPPTAPRRFVLKRNLQAPWAAQAGAREVAFYRATAPLSERLPMLVPCYDAAFDPTTRTGHLLFLDVSETHRQPLTRDQQLTPGANVPSDADIWRVVDALARFHAFWWNHPALGGDVAQLGAMRLDAASFEDYQGRVVAAWDRLAVEEGSWLPAGVGEAYDDLLPRLSLFWERRLGPRLASVRDVTLTHGDAYFANFLCPRDPAAGQTYLLDWQCPQVWWGADDLATLCATFWTPEQRREGRREERVLRRYLDTLQASGVTGYDWGDLLRDYRLGVLAWLLVPLVDRAGGAARDYWWPKMRCLLGAYRNLDRAALLR